MPRLAIFNVFFGFSALALGAGAGAFIATQITNGYLIDRTFLESWELLMHRSAHGHFNLFAIIQIVFGLSLHYSELPPTIKRWQTVGLVAGLFAMGPGLMLRAIVGPSSELDALASAQGLLLSATLLAIVTHAYGVYIKFTRHL